MKTNEFELLIKSGGIESVEIEAVTDKETTFSLHISPKNMDFRLDHSDPYFFIESARGTRRHWRDLTRLYKFIRDSGWSGEITIFDMKKIKLGGGQ